MITDTGRDLLDRLLPGHLELLEEWLVGPLRGRGLDEFVGSLRLLRDLAAPVRDGRQRGRGRRRAGRRGAALHAG